MSDDKKRDPNEPTFVPSEFADELTRVLEELGPKDETRCPFFVLIDRPHVIEDETDKDGDQQQDTGATTGAWWRDVSPRMIKGLLIALFNALHGEQGFSSQQSAAQIIYYLSGVMQETDLSSRTHLLRCAMCKRDQTHPNVKGIRAVARRSGLTCVCENCLKMLGIPDPELALQQIDQMRRRVS